MAKAAGQKWLAPPDRHHAGTVFQGAVSSPWGAKARASNCKSDSGHDHPSIMPIRLDCLSVQEYT